MKAIEIKEKNLDRALLVFVLPFSIKEYRIVSLKKTLGDQQYEAFKLDDLSLERKYYGDFQIFHENIEGYYLPFTNKILFPSNEKQEGFHRFSKQMNLDCYYNAEKFSLPFQLLSTDVTLCPMNVGFITIRLQIGEDANFSSAMEFAKRFRSLSSKRYSRNEISLKGEEKTFKDVKEFIIKHLNPSITDYFDKTNMEESYFETFPFFEDDRMYVQSIFSFKENDPFEKMDVFRAANLDGSDSEGKPSISSTNRRYIHEFLKENSYDRWAPDTYYVVKEDHFSCITNEERPALDPLVSQMFGEYYYGLLLNLFHKIVLLKIANDYSEIRIDKDREKVEELIYIVNSFTANYYFIELATQSQGRDIFLHLRDVFKIEEMYDDGKQTLYSLYRYQESFSDKKNSLLLLYLTLFTVISGIYGMNQVIEDLKGNIKWGKLAGYSLFEYIALFVTVSGLIVAVYLTISSFLTWRNDRKKRELWERKTAVSTRNKY
ncbi:hypothetical protein JOC77_003125 [Peribacillus deserti]|uniref:Group-specific protein n=1 Tax=Peribacillus deserti TaxID=673318 RepID=A0ABS2QKJ3_9BACI|nr:hypothetical protein [Peribacillus deserti]MBM7693681.1 hypothetical protein [Peribacillus deserti]